MLEVSYPVNIEAPDITPYREGNTGVEYVTTFDSGKSGPHVMLSAVVHGNELCGAIALDYLLRHEVRPIAGRLTFAFMNVSAFERFDPANPTLSRYVDEDFNRLWSHEVLESDRDSAELRRARAVRPIVDQVDYLLDIHSMQHSTVPLMMCGPLEKGRRLARELASPEHVVSDAGHAAGPRMRDYRAFADASSERNALLVECGQHWDSASVAVAKEISLRFLARYQVVDPAFVEEHLTAIPPRQQRLIEVTGPITIETDNFRFTESFSGMEVIEREGTLIGWDGSREVRTPYDNCVLIMPSRRLRRGESAVRLGRYSA
ncbi:MAG: succinylglutamate desuccinylase [Gammaproteobacteria bacterium]|nr:succinylglutamate desuccinylase [Gammaproteobacteria bacterium]NIM74626.1 succinylglutamate desuccinylase [Gammaproteobacteria bacterium]NIO26459.1 succinylglutamate desuccinylase [Gammaproteobacteria bacterium]NIO67011.1 succinylglutamate desuccinylase [Gammaproteobacteria bacterium]NIP46791.1 succinylglutamate desuccinylase [Gammaproteobacteria bacterium]